MTLEVNIRPLEATDQSAWLPLWQGYQDFYRVSIPDGVTSTTWPRLLDPTEPVYGALAWNGDKALGMVHFIQHRSCWTAGDYCYLQDLFVAEARRGSGIGRKLIEHVYAMAAGLGCARVYWLTHETNQAAMRLYDRVATRSGFIQYRRDLPAKAPEAEERRA
jgi:GNAT superfamily N-acetyltransferase